MDTQTILEMIDLLDKKINASLSHYYVSGNEEPSFHKGLEVGKEQALMELRNCLKLYVTLNEK